jgi:hypothetical protein
MSMWHAVREGLVVPSPTHVAGLPSLEFCAYAVPGAADLYALSNRESEPYALALPVSTSRWPHRVAWALELARARGETGPPPPPEYLDLPVLRELWETRKGAKVRLIAHDLVFSRDAAVWCAARLAAGKTGIYANVVAFGADTFAKDLDFSRPLDPILYAEPINLF